MCEKHNKLLQEVCGTLSCGMCYEEQMFREPLEDTEKQPKIIYVYEPSAHRKVMKAKYD